jgi:hypothetical protein
MSPSKNFGNIARLLVENNGHKACFDGGDALDAVLWAGLKVHWESSDPKRWDADSSKMRVRTDEELGSVLKLIASRGHRDRILMYFDGV